MTKIVEVPNLGNVEFPDSMSDADISAAIQKQIGGGKQAEKPSVAAPRQRAWYELPGGRTGGEMGQPGAYVPGGIPSAKEQAAAKAGGYGLLMGAGAPVLAGMEMVAPEQYRRLESAYQAQRQKAGDTGIDVPRTAAESLYLGLLPEYKAATALGRVGKTAAGVAGLTAATQPTQALQGNVLEAKAKQVAGAAAGGAGGALLGEAVGGMLGRKAAGTAARPLEGLSQQEATQATKQVNEFVDKMGVRKEDLEGSILNELLLKARNAKTLDNLDPKAIARLNTLRRAGVTDATIGQLTRDPLQRQTEIQAQQLAGGQELRDLSVKQNQQLNDSIRSLVGSDVAKVPYESTAAGRGVRETLEAKYRSLSRGVSRLYKNAEAVAGNTPVNASPLAEHLNSHADPGLIPYVKNKLPKDAYTVDENGLRLTRDLTLKELEIVRKAATNAKLAGGDKGYYAGEITDLIDNLTKDSGGEVYAAARAARRQVGEEFERTKAVNDLVKTRGISREKAVALEDVWRQSVVRGSVDDLRKLKDSLTKPVAEGRLGGQRTRALTERGSKAWDDLRSATADYLASKATRSPTNAAGDPNVQWNAFRNAVNEIGPEKLELLYGKQGAAKINDIVEALEIIKTEAPNDWKGSSTFKNLLGFLDTAGSLGGKYLGSDVLAGAVKGIAKLKESGQAGRTARAAIESPLTQKRAAKLPQTLSSITRKTTIPTVTITRGMQDQQEQPQ